MSVTPTPKQHAEIGKELAEIRNRLRKVTDRIEKHYPRNSVETDLPGNGIVDELDQALSHLRSARTLAERNAQYDTPNADPEWYFPTAA